MSWSDIIAAASLIVSISVGILNWRYTRKVFEISTRPIVESKLCFSSKHIICAKIRNLSTAIAVIDIRIVVEIKNPNWIRRPWRKRLFPVTEKHGYTLGPLEGQDLENIDCNFERILSSKCPNYMKYHHTGYYFTKPPSPLKVYLTTHYKPAIIRQANQKIKKTQVLSANTEKVENRIRFESWKFDMAQTK